MSVAIMTEVWRMKLGPTDKLVLLSLADWSNEDGVCWPSMKRLSEKTGLTDRAIRASVGRLRDAGHLTRDEIIGKGVNYIIHPGTSFPPERNAPRNETPQTPEGRSANTSRNTNTSSETTVSSEARAVAVKAKPVRRASRRAPNDWSPSVQTMQTLAADGYEPGGLERALAMVRDHLFRSARTDWDATFRNWVRRDPPSARDRHDLSNHNRPPDRRRSDREANLARAFAAADAVADRGFGSA